MVWLCSNLNCPDKSKQSKGSVCPSCGSPTQEFSLVKSISHLSSKSRSKKGEERKADALFLPEMTDEEIARSIYRDILSLSSQELGMSLADLFAEEDEEDSLSAQLLKTLVDQNRIVIRQNELILRALSKRASRMEIATTS